MDWQMLELFLFFVSYVLFAVAYLWLAIGEPLLRLRADWLALKSEQAKAIAQSMADDLVFKGVPPLDR